jgi:hypothetical protein
MRFNKHLNLRGEHAFLSPSSYHWLNYSPERLIERWVASQAMDYGTMQHDYAMREINANRQSNLIGTIGLYINDAIKYRMSTEQVLYYSENCFGTADAIAFRYNTLRIHDLKTGVYPGSPHQLEIYAALFCIEYKVDPLKIKYDLRIYQSDEVILFDVDPDDILWIIGRIREFDRLITHRRREEET